jgi:glycosyltransferase involved in cell wall biosynthesis
MSEKILMKKLNVSAIVVFYNEEKRAEAFLKSLAWCKEIIVFDKSSTDRTYEISSKYATKIIKIPFSEASEGFSEQGRAGNEEWIYLATAASVLHPKVVEKLAPLLTDKNFAYDVIDLPYKIYAFGIHSEHSPWYAKYKTTLIRKRHFKPNNKLHQEVASDSDKIYRLPWIDEESVRYHLTHPNLDNFFLKHMRYTKYEANFPSEITTKDLKKSFFEIFKAVGVVLLKRKSYLLGWDGVALGLAYITYFTMRFLYIWERLRTPEFPSAEYSRIQRDVISAWENYKIEN